MKTQMPNPRTTTSQTAHHMTAEGKKKAPIGMPALSLQDVFSDSENMAGMHQKTLPMFANEHGKMTQLQKKKAKNTGQKGMAAGKSFGKVKGDPSNCRCHHQTRI
jgi:hypothetical protein